MTSQQEAVTVAITHHVKPGCEQAFDDWLHSISDYAAGFSGYQGYVVLPSAAPSNERHVALRFRSLEGLNAYWASPETIRRRAALDDLVSEPSEIQSEVGIEHWFMKPSGPGPPPRHRMSVAVFLAILPLVTVIPPRLKPWLAGYMPAWLAGVLTTAVLVLLMSYIAMPIVTGALRGWLSPQPQREE